jgi:hypothetical protein
MKKVITNELIKNISYVLGYWIVFVITPFIIASHINNYIIYHPSSAQVFGYSPFYISIYILFIAPLFYFIPYLLIKPRTPLAKFLYVFWGVVLPYLFIYIFIYLGFENNFHIL